MKTYGGIEDSKRLIVEYVRNRFSVKFNSGYNIFDGVG